MPNFTPTSLPPPGVGLETEYIDVIVNAPLSQNTLLNLNDYDQDKYILVLRAWYQGPLAAGNTYQLEFTSTDNNTGRVLLTKSVNVPPGITGGYAPFPSFVTGVAHVKNQFDVNGPMNLQIVCKQYKNNSLTGTYTATFIISGDPVGPPLITCIPGDFKCFGPNRYQCNPTGDGWILIEENSPICGDDDECPNFFLHPVDHILCRIVKAFEAALGVVSGGFITLLANLQNWMDNWSQDLVLFILDFPGNILDAVNDGLTGLSSFISGVTNAINQWYQENLIFTITNIWTAITSVTTWVDDQFDNIGEWWTQAQTDLAVGFTTWWDDVNDFWDEFTTNLGQWWDETKKGAWDALTASVESFTSWVAEGYDSIASWWTDQQILIANWIAGPVADAAEWMSDNFMGFLGWINELNVSISVYIAQQTTNMADYIQDNLPDWVEGLFEWAKPLIDPIIGISDAITSFWDMISGNYAEESEIKANKNTIKQKQQELDDLLQEI